MVRYTIYIDKLIMVVWGFHMLQLFVMKKFFLCTATLRRILVMATLGTIVFGVWFFLIKGPLFWRLESGILLSNLLIIPLCFRWVRRTSLWKAYLFSMNGLFVFGSLLMRLLEQKSKATIWCTGINLLLCLWLLSGKTYVYQEKRGTWRQPVLPVILTASEKRISVRALIDSGNHLVEPISGKPVHIISEKLAREFVDELPPEAYIIIPFGSVGCAKGYLEGYRIPELTIRFDLEDITLKNQIVAIGKNALEESCPYQMILHPSVKKRRTEHAVIGGRKSRRTMSAAWSK